MTPRTAVEGVIAALPEPAMLLDPRGRVACVNDAARERFGAWIEGQSYVSVLRQPALLAPVEDAFFGGRRGAARFRHVAGEVETTFEVTIAPQAALAQDGRPAVLLAFRDVSDAAFSAAIRQDFVANVSHELKTPLTAVMGFVETLQGPARDDAAARERFLALMAQELARMDRLVSDLLSLGRVEAQVRRRPRDVVDLALLMAEAADPLRPSAEAAGVRLEIDLPARALAPAERDQMVQLGQNLIANAIKYGRQPGRVTVRLAARERDPVIRGPAWLLTVTDDGAGIAPEHLPRLTERFYRVDTGRVKATGGTGLGLAIVKHIVNRHRGRLRIDSRPGEGTTVTVALPAWTGAAEGLGGERQSRTPS